MLIKILVILSIFYIGVLSNNTNLEIGEIQQPHNRMPTVLTDTNDKVETRQTRILGGKPARPGQIPYQVGLFMRATATSTSGFWCGGTLISNQFVLTASHCIVLKESGQVGASVIVFLGATNRNNPNEPGQIRVEAPQQNLIKHNEYNSATLVNDIALIMLPFPVEFSTIIQPASLPSREQSKIDIVGKKIISSGWGVMGTSNSSPAILQYMLTQVNPGKKCSDLFGAASFNDERQVCINAPGKSTCQGDSGGPHVINENAERIVIGVTSYGAVSCSVGYPQVLTRVGAYLYWIEQNTGIQIQ